MRLVALTLVLLFSLNAQAEIELFENENDLNAIVTSKEEKKSSNFIKEYFQVRKKFKKFSKSEEGKSLVLEFNKKVKALKKGNISQEMKDEFDHFKNICKEDKLECRSAFNQLIPTLRNYFYHSSIQRQPRHQQQYTYPGWAYAVGCINADAGYMESNVHILLYGYENEISCESQFGHTFELTRQSFGPGLSIGDNLTAIICPLGMKTGTHFGVSASASGILGVTVGTLIGRSGICAEVGLMIGLGAKLVVTKTDIQ